ncbi:hypothetical protein SCHPADRAFT_746829 [Schizopora paradoxa]|uniref:Uncharacterized protein n=1 Tax=Schizopora paradoxa TaxID=27342 RepID=A0A0H2R5G9_9AGAM|nr:hypothetical protein SCHPADRAFT_746829 [Schizopora paradoxa]
MRMAQVLMDGGRVVGVKWCVRPRVFDVRGANDDVHGVERPEMSTTTSGGHTAAASSLLARVRNVPSSLGHAFKTAARPLRHLGGRFAAGRARRITTTGGLCTTLSLSLSLPYPHIRRAQTTTTTRGEVDGQSGWRVEDVDVELNVECSQARLATTRSLASSRYVPSAHGAGAG